MHRFRHGQCRFRWKESAGQLLRECVSETSVEETWNPANFGWWGLLVSGPRKASAPTWLDVHLHPDRCVVAGLLPAARGAIDASALEPLGQYGAEKRMI